LAADAEERADPLHRQPARVQRDDLGAPVLGPGGCGGALTVESSGLRSFDKAATDFVQSMANVIGAALK
jgi:hypothetical protein